MSILAGCGMVDSGRYLAMEERNFMNVFVKKLCRKVPPIYNK